MSLGDDPSADRRVQRTERRRLEQFGRITFRQAAQAQLRQSLELTGGVTVAFGKHNDNRLDMQPPRDEREHLSG